MSINIKHLESTGIFGEVVTRVKTEQPLVALTFDDGPHPVYTPAIANLLNAYGAKATFFVLGRHAERNPSIIKALANDGHEIGNHTFHHYTLSRQTLDLIRTEILRTDDIIRSAGYKGNIYFRPPFGQVSFPVLAALKSLKRITVLWTLDLQDWAGTSAEDMFAMFEKRIAPGCITLLHDQARSLPESLPKPDNTIRLVQHLLEVYIPQGYKFVTLSELFQVGELHPGVLTSDFLRKQIVMDKV